MEECHEPSISPWHNILPSFARRFRPQLTLCDHAQSAASTAASPNGEDEELRLRQAQLLERLQMQDMSVGLDDLVKDGLCDKHQERVLSQVFGFLAGGHVNDAMCRPAPVKVKDFETTRHHRDLPFWQRVARRRRDAKALPPASMQDVPMTPEEVQSEIQAKLALHQRKLYHKLLSRYEHCATQQLQLPGSRAISTETLAKARERLETTCPALASQGGPGKRPQAQPENLEGNEASMTDMAEASAQGGPCKRLKAELPQVSKQLNSEVHEVKMVVTPEAREGCLEGPHGPGAICNRAVATPCRAGAGLKRKESQTAAPEQLPMSLAPTTLRRKMRPLLTLTRRSTEKRQGKMLKKSQANATEGKVTLCWTFLRRSLTTTHQWPGLPLGKAPLRQSQETVASTSMLVSASGEC